MMAAKAAAGSLLSLEGPMKARKKQNKKDLRKFHKLARQIASL